MVRLWVLSKTSYDPPYSLSAGPQEGWSGSHYASTGCDIPFQVPAIGCIDHRCHYMMHCTHHDPTNPAFFCPFRSENMRSLMYMAGVFSFVTGRDGDLLGADLRRESDELKLSEAV